jgi:GINS complex subunit 3
MSYYDIDSILAEEELVPCTTLFDFSHLGHLDEYSTTSYLKEKSKLQMPLWALEKWTSLSYVKLQLPKHFNVKTRERLEADPLALNLRYE